MPVPPASISSGTTASPRLTATAASCYVQLENGTDIGLAMIQAGYATELAIGSRLVKIKPELLDKPHDRTSGYVAA